MPIIRTTNSDRVYRAGQRFVQAMHSMIIPAQRSAATVRMELTRCGLETTWLTEFRLRRVSNEAFSGLCLAMVRCSEARSETVYGKTLLVPSRAVLEEIQIENLPSRELLRKARGEFFDLTRLEELVVEWESTLDRADQSSTVVERLRNKRLRLESAFIEARQKLAELAAAPETTVDQFYEELGKQLCRCGISDVVLWRRHENAADCPWERLIFTAAGQQSPLSAALTLPDRLTRETVSSQLLFLGDTTQEADKEIPLADLVGEYSLPPGEAPRAIYVAQIQAPHLEAVVACHGPLEMNKKDGESGFFTSSPALMTLVRPLLRNLILEFAQHLRQIRSKLPTTVSPGQYQDTGSPHILGRRFVGSSKVLRRGKFVIELLPLAAQELAKIPRTVIDEAVPLIRGAIGETLGDVEVYHHVNCAGILCWARDVGEEHPTIVGGYRSAAFAGIDFLQNLHENRPVLGWLNRHFGWFRGRDTEDLNMIHLMSTMVDGRYQGAGLMIQSNFPMFDYAVRFTKGFVWWGLMGIVNRGIPGALRTQSYPVYAAAKRMFAHVNTFGKPLTGRAKRRLAPAAERLGWEMDGEGVQRNCYQGTRTGEDQRIRGLGERDAFTVYFEHTIWSHLKMWWYCRKQFGKQPA